MRIEVCIDVSEGDMALLVLLSRQTNTPIDSIIRKAIAEYTSRLVQQAGGGGG
jgi:hypothetical protein